MDVAATNDRAWIFYEGDEAYIRIQLTGLYYKFYGQGTKKGIDTVKHTFSYPLVNAFRIREQIFVKNAEFFITGKFPEYFGGGSF